MKKIIKWLTAAVLLICIIAGAALLYNKLSENFSGNNLIGSSQTSDNASSKSANAAPDFTVLDSEGNEVKLSDYRGKPVVLNFWATWCYYCKLEMPDFNEAYKKYPDIQFLMVNATDGIQETESTAKEYIRKENYQFDVFFDVNQQAVKAYYVTGFPATFFIDKDGNIVTRGSGMLNMEKLEKGIKMIREQEN